jgi:hypothetical protein
MKRAVWAVFFHKLLTNEKPQHGVSQVVVTVGVNSRTVGIQGMHMNTHIFTSSCYGLN